MTAAGTTRSRISLAVATIGSLLGAVPVMAGIPLVTPPEDARILNFDDIANAPTSFTGNDPLRARYEAIGIDFSGPGNSGGVVLNENGSFSISGFSPPNVLAFNTAATLPAGGKPQFPQTLLFREPVRYVQFNVGDTGGITITAEAFDAADVSLDVENVTPANAMQTVVLEGRHIAKVVISGGGLSYIVDDIAFVLDTTVIDFDEESAPTAFLDATALARKYFPEGFEQSRTNGKNGGAILNDGAGLFVTGYSPPNFLAVNDNAGLADGGTAQFPIYLQFFPPVEYVEFLAGQFEGSTITVRGSFFGGPTVDEAVVEVEAAMKPVVLEGGAMTFVEITSTGTSLVIDDLQYLVAGTKIDFDDYTNVPTFLGETTAIRTRYALLGVTFSAPNEKDGLALVGNNIYGVTDLSGTNFLAFDESDLLGNGGTPKLPETILFDRPMARVDFWIGSNAGTRIFLEGFDAAGQSTGTNDQVTTSRMEVMTAYLEGTTRIELTTTGTVGVIDNLSFAPTDPCPFDLCYQGGTFNRHCSECSTIMCSENLDCCNDGWDFLCAVTAEATCGLTCGPLCGDANEDRKVTAPDALGALRTAVGADDCPAFRCDFNGQDGVLSSDALLILRTGVGLETNPNCPPEPL